MSEAGGAASKRGAELRFARELKSLRAAIDAADAALLKVLARRFRVVDRIGELKRRAGAPVMQKQRRKQILDDRRQAALKLGLDPDFVQALFERIQKESVSRQKRIVAGKGDGARAASAQRRRQTKRTSKRSV